MLMFQFCARTMGWFFLLKLFLFFKSLANYTHRHGHSMPEPSHITRAPCFPQEFIFSTNHFITLRNKTGLGGGCIRLWWLCHGLDCSETVQQWRGQARQRACRSWGCPWFFFPLSHPSALHKPTWAGFPVNPRPILLSPATPEAQPWLILKLVFNEEVNVCYPKPSAISCLVFFPRPSRAVSRPWAAPSIQ